MADHKLLGQLSFIKRKRTPPSIILLGLIVYFKGLSFRRGKDILMLLGMDLCHTSIWKWLRKHVASLKDHLWVRCLLEWWWMRQGCAPALFNCGSTLRLTPRLVA